MYEIIPRLSGIQHLYVSHRPSLISAPPTVHMPHGCTLIPVYWAGFLILSYSCSLAPTLQLPSVWLSVLSLLLFFSLLPLCTFLCHPVISFPPTFHGRAGSSSAPHNMTLNLLKWLTLTTVLSLLLLSWFFCFLFCFGVVFFSFHIINILIIV